MQRVRIGIIGLASVFLLTMLATAVYSLLGAGPPPGASASNGATAAENAADAPREPLAELGVAPGNVPPADNAAAPATRPPARPKR